MKRINWLTVLLVLVGAAVWLEILVRNGLYGVILLAAAGGWWDYQRRRSKLKPR